MVVLKSSVSNYVTLDDKTYSWFAGNNYLGLANNPAVIRDVINAVQKYGINFSASRQTTGTSVLHLELEKLLSDFHNKPASIVFASGYSGNRILLHSLRNQYSALFYDELSHPSITDGFPSDVINKFKYNHCDAEHLEILLKANAKFSPLIITDGVFALTGDLAPLDKIARLAHKYNAILIVDEAHATGVLGKNGKGTVEHFNLDNSPDIYQSGTMSKALGAYGGFISGEKDIIDSIRVNSSPYLASTALPPPIVSAAISAIKIIQQQPELRQSLFENSRKIKDGIKKMGFAVNSEDTPIIPLSFDYEQDAINLSLFLRENNIIIPYVKYPVKIDKFIVRITVSSIHTKEQIEELLAVIKTWRNKYEINKNQ